MQCQGLVSVKINKNIINLMSTEIAKRAKVKAQKWQVPLHGHKMILAGTIYAVRITKPFLIKVI